jgi:hypothetical protein
VVIGDDPSMPFAGLLIGGAVFTGLLVIVGTRAFRRRGPGASDLGSISEQWITQHAAHSRDYTP